MVGATVDEDPGDKDTGDVDPGDGVPVGAGVDAELPPPPPQAVNVAIHSSAPKNCIGHAFNLAIDRGNGRDLPGGHKKVMIVSPCCKYKNTSGDSTRGTEFGEVSGTIGNGLVRPIDNLDWSELGYKCLQFSDPLGRVNPLRTGHLATALIRIKIRAIAPRRHPVKFNRCMGFAVQLPRLVLCADDAGHIANVTLFDVAV